MFCSKCGNEIKENERFCSKCGNQIESNIEQVTNNQGNNSNLSNTTKKTIITVSCVVILLAIIAGVVMNVAFNSNGVIQTASSLENTSKEEKQKILDVIDEDKGEFKINAQTLIQAIKEVNDEIEQEERAPFKSPITICDKSTQTNPATQKQVTSYVLGNSLSSVNSSYPFIIISNTDTNNIYRICVYHPYLNGYGTEANTTAIIRNYKILFRALEKINQDELGRAIYDMEKHIESATASIPGEFNIRGVHISGADGAVNKYGNKTGVYYIYCTK